MNALGIAVCIAYAVVWAGSIFLLWPLARRAAAGLIHDSKPTRGDDQP